MSGLTEGRQADRELALADFYECAAWCDNKNLVDVVLRLEDNGFLVDVILEDNIPGDAIILNLMHGPSGGTHLIVEFKSGKLTLLH